MIQKNIVIDFDRTIGYFYQFNIICQYLMNKYPEYIENPIDAFSQMDEIFRPNIFKIIKMIVYAKEKNKIDKLILYTKNENEYLINIVIDYIKHKIGNYPNHDVFDIVLQCEKKRKKNIHEIVEAHLNETEGLHTQQQICIMDDKVYEKMIKDNVFYIHCIPYVYEYKTYQITEILEKKNKGFDQEDFLKYFSLHHKDENRKMLSRKNHMNLSKNIIQFLLTFINHKF